MLNGIALFRPGERSAEPIGEERQRGVLDNRIDSEPLRMASRAEPRQGERPDGCGGGAETHLRGEDEEFHRGKPRVGRTTLVPLPHSPSASAAGAKRDDCCGDMIGFCSRQTFFARLRSK